MGVLIGDPAPVGRLPVFLRARASRRQPSCWRAVVFQPALDDRTPFRTRLSLPNLLLAHTPMASFFRSSTALLRQQASRPAGLRAFAAAPPPVKVPVALISQLRCVLARPALGRLDRAPSPR